MMLMRLEGINSGSVFSFGKGSALFLNVLYYVNEFLVCKSLRC